MSQELQTNLRNFTLEETNLIKDMVTEAYKSQVARDISDTDFNLFMYYCKKTGLDPLAKQVFAVPRSTKKKVGDDWTTVVSMSIQTSIDGYRLIAGRTGAHAGTDDTKFDYMTNDKGERDMQATTTVYRIVGGVRCAFTASARFSEYAAYYEKKDRTTGKTERTLNNMWQTKPYLMLAKCSEALALRKAFPQELSGMYTQEEMDQADNPQVSRQDKIKDIEDIVDIEDSSVEPESTPVQEREQTRKPDVLSNKMEKLKELAKENRDTEPKQSTIFDNI